jgi:hypothetical protein
MSHAKPENLGPSHIMTGIEIFLKQVEFNIKNLSSQKYR